jgi:hypothetical protein
MNEALKHYAQAHAINRRMDAATVRRDQSAAQGTAAGTNLANQMRDIIEFYDSTSLGHQIEGQEIVASLGMTNAEQQRFFEQELGKWYEKYDTWFDKLPGDRQWEPRRWPKEPEPPWVPDPPDPDKDEVEPQVPMDLVLEETGIEGLSRVVLKPVGPPGGAPGGGPPAGGGGK